MTREVELVTVEWIPPALEIHKLTTTPERIAAMAAEQAERKRQLAGAAGRGASIVQGCHCKMDGFYKGWHLRGAPECAAASTTDGELYLFAIEAS